MGDLGVLLKLISDNGLAIVLAALGGIGVWYLFRLNQTMWQDRFTTAQADAQARLKDEQERVAYIEERRAEERAGRLAADARLASNADTLREATSAFVAAQSLMATLIERDGGSQPARRRST